jgi:hypothetical protein
MIWSDYVAGPDNPYPLLYFLPVCVAAWYSGQGAAIALAAGMPVIHLGLLLVVWNEQPTFLSLTMFLLRTAVVALLALVVARQADYEREFRRELQRRHAVRLRAEQLRVVQVTMRSVEDIVNNCLNQLQLLRLEAEGLVPEESLTTFDQAVRDASAKLRALAELQAFAEKQMAIGMGLDAGAPEAAPANPPLEVEPRGEETRTPARSLRA